MLANMKIIVVLPAYNAAETLKQTYDEIPHDIAMRLFRMTSR
jgi:hypothetical protein